MAARKTKATDSAIHIALAFDQNFWAPAYATMRSICLSTRRRTDLIFHLCHTGLGADAVSDLEKIGEEFGATLVEHDIMENADFRHFSEALPHTRHISAVMYARLAFGSIIPAEVKRLVYLDCDILVRAPIEELAEADLGGHPLGAIKEPHGWRFANGRDARDNHDLFDPADPFFNSGVLVIDLDAWRKAGVVDTLHGLEADGTLKRLTNDQVVLNYLFKGNWQALDPRWNALAAGKAMEMLDPKAVHYTGLNKPWNLWSGLPFARVYRHVMTNELFYRYMRYRWKRKFKR